MKALPVNKPTESDHWRKHWSDLKRCKQFYVY